MFPTYSQRFVNDKSVLLQRAAQKNHKIKVEPYSHTKIINVAHDSSNSLPEYKVLPSNTPESLIPPARDYFTDCAFLTEITKHMQKDLQFSILENSLEEKLLAIDEEISPHNITTNSTHGFALNKHALVRAIDTQISRAKAEKRSFELLSTRIGDSPLLVRNEYNQHLSLDDIRNRHYAEHACMKQYISEREKTINEYSAQKDELLKEIADQLLNDKELVTFHLMTLGSPGSSTQQFASITEETISTVSKIVDWCFKYNPDQPKLVVPLDVDSGALANKCAVNSELKKPYDSISSYSYEMCVPLSLAVFGQKKSLGISNLLRSCNKYVFEDKNKFARCGWSPLDIYAKGWLQKNPIKIVICHHGRNSISNALELEEAAVVDFSEMLRELPSPVVT